ncbi:MAG: RHS repeat-associated core domain-containing protein, partial [Candidatus Thiodiazotropha sp.]
GNYEGAAFAATGLVPGGKVAGKLAKGARMLLKASKRARRARRVGNVSKIAKHARKARRPRKRDGFKVKGKRRKKKKDKPCKKCPKNKGPGGKAVMTALPVHYGTGEELLEQTDFEVEGEIAFDWTRSYRSGSECEDWGLLGARWATPYTASLSLSVRGIVYHEESGRALRLPPLAIGAEHDHGIEGFILRRDSDTHFTLTWRDGSTDTFEQGPDGWLPHGYDGANAMRKPQPPERVTRCYLTRSEERDGRGITIERLHEALPGEPLLRLRGDDGLLIEALRDETALNPQTSDPDQPPRIGRVEQILPDGRRVCHVTYHYEAEPVAPKPAYARLAEGHEAFETLPQRCNLVEQTNILGHNRRYGYRHHLLLQYSNYNGFSYRFSWISLAQLRERWAGSQLDAKELASLHPITLYNSYQARATVSVAEDGTDRCLIDYIDEDTSRVTEPDGGMLEYTFDENWLATEVRRIPNDGGPAQSLGRREWDENANLTAEIDAEGNTTRYAYDQADNLTVITDALGHTSRVSYDDHNQPVSVTDPLGNAYHQNYDERGNLIESRDPLGNTTRYDYNEANRLIHLTDAKGGVKKLDYDPAGHVIAYTDCSSHTTRYAYDEGGRLSAVTDPLGQITQYRYDPLGRLGQVTYPDQASERYEYDPQDNLISHSDANGQITRYRYNGQGLPIERIDAKGQTLHYRYDSALRLVELINGNGESYTFTYDAEGRLASETGFDGKTTSYAYDPAGQLIASESGGVRTDYHRDPLGQLLTKLTPESHNRYAYDPLGRLTAVRTPRAEQRYAYDAVGQLIEERHRYALEPGEPPQAYRPSAAFKLKHEYDPLGNRIRTWLPNGRSINTLRYGPGHWHGTRWSGRTIADLERDALHRETSRQMGSGPQPLTTHSDYDPQSRLTGLRLTHAGKALRERRYRYDLEGNLTHIDDRQQGVTRYTYDPIGQLLSAIQPDLKETFAFDPAGNLVDKPEREKAGRAESDQETREALPIAPLFVRHNRIERYHNLDYEYDIQGNTVLKRINPMHLPNTQAANETATLDLTYDQENRLVKAIKRYSQASVIAQYIYDAFGRRIAKTVSEARWEKPAQQSQAEKNATPRTTWFLWDGDNLLQETHPDKTITYLYEPESFVPLARIESDEGQMDYLPDTIHLPPVQEWEMLENPLKCESHVRLWWRYEVGETEKAHQAQWKARQEQARQNAQNDRIHYYYCDHLGTPQALYGEEGQEVWSARYQAWGRIYRYEKKEIEQPLRFQGQYEDEETGLYYNHFRYYDPDSGKFLQHDPLELKGGENLYLYAPNPTVFIDPLGFVKKVKYKNKELDEFAQGKKTTTIGRYPDGSLGISSSDRYVPGPLRKWAEERGIKVVSGEGHGEVTLIKDGACHVDASRGVCIDCEKYMRRKSVTTNTPFTGKKSRGRRRKR